jgi:hypothetical protein
MGPGKSMLNVHVRINDNATGQPTPARIRISDAASTTYAPLGLTPEFPKGRNEDVGGRVLLGTDRWFYIDGSCEVPLPSGIPLQVEVWKGPEFTPLRETLTLGQGQMAIRLSLTRRFDWRKEGWIAGDPRCHFISPHAALLEARAEGLPVVELLALETPFLGQDGLTYRITPHLTAFSGQQPLLDRDGHIIAVNTMNRHPILGSLALLHCHRPVFPLTFGGADATDDWSLADWCDQCHRKRGLVVWVDPFRADDLVPDEALSDLVLGRIDAIEVAPTSIRPKDWYRAWNAGLRFALVGASGKDSNRVCLGAMRTYARLSDAATFSLSEWIEGIRLGRTSASTGPLLELEAGGKTMGSTLDLSEVGVEVPVRVRIRGALQGSVEIIVNGAVCERRHLSSDDEEMEFTRVWNEPGWIAARFVDARIQGQFAHTSPVYVTIRGQPRQDPVARQWLRQNVERTLEWVTTTGRFEKPRRREQLVEILRQALDWLTPEGR